MSATLWLLIALPPAAAAIGCPDVQGGIAAASTQADPDLARELYSAAEASGTCSGEALLMMGRNVAYAHYHAAYREGVSDNDRETLLKSALDYGRPWQVLAAAADAHREGRRYAQATALYQEALDDIRDEHLNPIAPPVAVIASIHKKAEETRLLAPHYVSRVDRSGRPGGLSNIRIRGFSVTRTAVPVHFEFDSTAFTPEGREAVKDLLGYLAVAGDPDIELVGHTDERGSDSYNQLLSVRRAEAVRSFMLAAGYGGQVTVSGRGESEPFEADDPDAYSQEERWKLDRRVELRR